MLLALWRESGIKPVALTKKPKLSDSDRYFYGAFWQLSPSRGQGESFGPIPQSEFLAYWHSYGVAGIHERDRFQAVVSMLDREYVDHVQKKRKAEMDKLKNGGGSGSSTRPGAGGLGGGKPAG